MGQTYRVAIYKRNNELVLKCSMKNLQYVRRLAATERSKGGQVYVNIRGGRAHGQRVAV